MYNVITNQDDEIYVTDTNEILALDALTKKDLDLALENYLPLSAGIDKKLTGDLCVDNNKFIKGYTTTSTLRNLIGVNTASDVELGDTNANINIKASSAFRPASNNETALGTDTLQWKEIYGTTIYQDGKQVANKEDLTNLENNKVNITNSDTTQNLYNHIYNDINNQTIVSSSGADFNPMSEEALPNSSYSSYFINNPMLQVIQNTYKDNEGNQTLTSISQSSGAITLQTQSQNGSSMINVGDGVTQIGDGNNFYNFENTSLNNTNNADLGTSTNKFKDLYLSGKLSNGTNEVTIDAIMNKVDKIEGKGLSTEDFTTELKEKLVSIDTTIAQNTLSIGSVSSGTTASATITGTAPNQILNLVLPKGDKGDTGEKGDKGEQGIQGDKGVKGDPNTLTIGSVSSGTTPSATITGQSPNQTLNLVLPKGDKGDTGETGATGPQGPQGPQGPEGPQGPQGKNGSVNKYPSTKTSILMQVEEWTSKYWDKLGAFNGSDIWTDGTDIYYSSVGSTGNIQRVLNKETSAWNVKTWNGLSNITANSIWTDRTNIYYSNGSKQYVLDKSTSTWNAKTWNGLSNFNGKYIWTDGTDIYFSNGSNHYVLNKSTWNAKTWNGLSSFTGDNIWTDGTDIYFSNDTNHYVLNKSTSTWNAKTWNGLSNFNGKYIWTDRTNIYYSNGSNQYVLDKSTSTWNAKTWNGLSSFAGDNIWTDGTNIYYSNNTYKFVLTSYTTKPTLK